MRKQSSLLLNVARVAIAAAALACGGGESGTNAVTGTGTLTTVNVTLGASTLSPGQTTTATATGLDQSGASVNTGTVTWTSSVPSVATVNSAGVVTAVNVGTTQIIGNADGKSGQATLTVSNATNAPVANVVVTPASVNLVIGTTQEMTATTTDANGNLLNGRIVTWSSSNPAIATVSPTGIVQAIAIGSASIVATSESKSGSATVTVAANTTAASCTPSSALKLALGQIQPLSTSQVGALCVGGMTGASEYVLIPFNNSNVSSSTTDVELASTNTVAVTTSPSVNVGAPRLTVNTRAQLGEQIEASFRARERSEVGGASFRSRARVGRPVSRASATGHSLLTGVPTVPAIGSVVQLNSNLSGNTCTDPAVLHPSRVVAVLTHTIVLIDTTSPPGGYTDAQLTAFGTTFDTLGFALDTTNFGANTDIDG
ncbi:MAG TPA: Ig-like domain-containing protein, partial [Gemmatimonadaceae bacterium]|nr:Ig-like domain-containing protein [Gemmatimonadaceae bacterium]